MGTDFRVSGTSVDGTNIVNTTVYVRTEDFERLRGDNVAYVLVGAETGVEPDRLARRIQTAVTGTTAQTRGEFARQEASVVRDMVADVMLLITVLDLLTAQAEIGRASCREKVVKSVKK